MEIKIQTERERFLSHLKLPDNNKVIFSGAFGIGKTYFLEKTLINNDQYETFVISPINYSISKNDDIIKYIKYDLAFELISKITDFKKEYFSKKDTIPYYLKENYKDIIQTLLKNSNRIGKTISSLIEINDKAQEHNKNLQLDEKRDIIEFLKSQKNSEGSIYEENIITELLSNKINAFEKESILIIEDLDRIDPEHIFRILNIFATHLNFDNLEKNKFSFNKIILVCDIENIRNVFFAKYGVNVDFSGYIDKFYSKEIFYFNNKIMVLNSIDAILKSIKVNEEYEHILNLKDRNIISRKLLIEVLENLINYNLINLRTLLKYLNSDYVLKIYSFKVNKQYSNSIENWQLQIVLFFDLLQSFYGSKINLKLSIEKLEKVVPQKSLYSNGFNRLYEIKQYEHLITFLDYRNNNFRTDKFTYKNKELDISIEYNIQYYGETQDEITCNITKISSYDETIDKEQFPFASLLKIAYDEYLKLEIIKYKA